MVTTSSQLAIEGNFEGLLFEGKTTIEFDNFEAFLY